MALALRLPQFFTRERATETEVTVLHPDADLNANVMFRQAYLVEHLQRHAPEHLGTPTRVGTPIRYSQESKVLLSELNRKWSHANGLSGSQNAPSTGGGDLGGAGGGWGEGGNGTRAWSG